MQGDEAFLSTLSVSAGNLDDIEGTLPGQVEVLNQMLVRCGGAGAAERLQNQLAALYREIKAVADGVQTSQVSVDEETAKSFRIEKDEEQMTEEARLRGWLIGQTMEVFYTVLNVWVCIQTHPISQEVSEQRGGDYTIVSPGPNENFRHSV